MGQLFGKSAAKRPPTASTTAVEITQKDRAILDLKNARDRLKKYRKKLEADSEKLNEKAKEFIRIKQKDRALMVLKLKKVREKELNGIDGQLISVLEMIQNVEWAAANLEVMKALKSGTSALNKIHEEMSLDDVCALLEDTNEAINVENSINAIIAGQFNTADDEELEKELEDLFGNKQDSTVDVFLPVAPMLPVLPVAPAANVSVSLLESAGNDTGAQGIKEQPATA
jgi:charged multivesicular body protein 6